MNKSLSSVVLMLMCMMMGAGCGTALNGENQAVVVNSVPPGASIWVDGVEAGRTPAILTIWKKSSHTLRIAREGFIDTTVTITSSLNAAFYLNILYPSFIGCAGDLMTGGGSSLSPDRVFVDLVRTRQQKDEH